VDENLPYPVDRGRMDMAKELWEVSCKYSGLGEKELAMMS